MLHALLYVMHIHISRNALVTQLSYMHVYSSLIIKWVSITVRQEIFMKEKVGKSSDFIGYICQNFNSSNINKHIKTESIFRSTFVNFNPSRLINCKLSFLKVCTLIVY